jgi:uncharacterized protein (DUF433 family)
MAVPIATKPTESIPLTVSPDDVIYVGGTRVTLDTVIEAFQDGATPEEIVYQYPFLDLADVYAVVGYYLRHRPQVESYLHQRSEYAERVRQQNERRFPPEGIRARLLARRQQQED